MSQILDKNEFHQTVVDDYGEKIINPYDISDVASMTEDYAMQQIVSDSKQQANEESIYISQNTNRFKRSIVGHIAKGLGSTLNVVASGFDKLNDLPTPVRVGAVIVGGAGAVAFTAASAPVAIVGAAAGGVISAYSLFFSRDIAKVADKAGNAVESVTGSKKLGAGTEFAFNIVPGVVGMYLGNVGAAGNLAKGASEAVKAGVFVADKADDVARAVNTTSKVVNIVDKADDVARVVDTTSKVVNAADKADDVARAVNTASRFTRYNNLIRNGVSANDEMLDMANKFIKTVSNASDKADDLASARQQIYSLNELGKFKDRKMAIKMIKYLDDAIAFENKASNPMAMVGNKLTNMRNGVIRNTPILGYPARNSRFFAHTDVARLNLNIDMARDLTNVGLFTKSQFANKPLFDTLTSGSKLATNIRRPLGLAIPYLSDNVSRVKVAANGLNSPNNFVRGISIASQTFKYSPDILNIAKDRSYALLNFSEEDRLKMHDLLVNKNYNKQDRINLLKSYFEDDKKLIIPTDYILKYGLDNYTYTSENRFVDIENKRVVNTDMLFKEVYGENYLENNIDNIIKNNEFVGGFEKNDNSSTNQTEQESSFDYNDIGEFEMDSDYGPDL